MSNFSCWKNQNIALLAAGAIAGASAPLVISAPAVAQQSNFSDVSFSYWARPFIQRLAAENIIAGFPDGTFKPDQPVTRAQFAAIVQQAFNQPATRSGRNFPDVPGNYWAQNAIQNAYRSGFLSGYPNGNFQPGQEIPRVQVLVSLSNGLDLQSNGSNATILDAYRDEAQIPEYAQDEVAAATQNNIVTNYPNPDLLNPQQVATRADVAAFIYQALVAQGKLPKLDASVDATKYIVGYSATGTTPVPSPNPATPDTQNPNFRVDANTVIDVRYPATAGREINIVVAPGQTVATTLEVAKPIRNARGQVLIPAGSTIQGRLVPVTIQGSSIVATKFVADRLTIGNNTYRIPAESSPIAATQNVAPSTLQGALVTAAAESILGSIRGNRDLAGVIGQVITGSGSATTQSAVIVVDPDQLALRVNSAFYIGSTGL